MLKWRLLGAGMVVASVAAMWVFVGWQLPVGLLVFFTLVAGLVLLTADY